jgi:hypothetical protein
MPIAVDVCTEPFVKFDSALIPFGDPPFDHSATRGRCLFGYSFHQELAYLPASVRFSDIKFLYDQVRLRSIGERNKIVNQKSNQLISVSRNETIKIGWRTEESLFAKHSFSNREVCRVFLKLGQFAPSTEANLEYPLRLLSEFPLSIFTNASSRAPFWSAATFRCFKSAEGSAHLTSPFPKEFRRTMNFRGKTLVNGAIQRRLF